MKRIFILMLALTLLPASQFSRAPQINLNQQRADTRSDAAIQIVSSSSKAASATVARSVPPPAPSSPPTTHQVTVNPDGTFQPAHIHIRPGDTVRWINLKRKEAIVQIASPDSNPQGDACFVNNNRLKHTFDANDPNEFTGPMRYGVSGISHSVLTDPALGKGH